MKLAFGYRAGRQNVFHPPWGRSSIRERRWFATRRLAVRSRSSPLLKPRNSKDLRQLLDVTISVTNSNVTISVTILPVDGPAPRPHLDPAPARNRTSPTPCGPPQCSKGRSPRCRLRAAISIRLNQASPSTRPTSYSSAAGRLSGSKRNRQAARAGWVRLRSVSENRQVAADGLLRQVKPEDLERRLDPQDHRAAASDRAAGCSWH